MSFNIFNFFKKRKPEIDSQSAELMPVVNGEIKLVPPQTTETTKLRSIIESIIQKHKGTDIEIFKPATPDEIARFEQQIGFPLPADFKEFYSICNGFGCTEDIFNMTPLEEISNIEKKDGLQGFYFAEYMIYSDSWGLRFIPEGKYEIFNGSYSAVAMTSSLEEFLNRFLLGNIFEKTGLYEWMDEVKIIRNRDK